MTGLGQIPFLRITIPFAAGIWVCEAVSFVMPPWWVGTCIFILFLFLFFLVMKVISPPSYRFRWCTGVVVVLLIMAAGYLRYLSFDGAGGGAPTPDGSMLSPVDAVVVLQEAPVRKARSYGVRVLVVASDDGNTLRVSRRGVPVMAWFPHDTAVALLQRGDTLLVWGTFSPLAPPGNPGAFDYSRYLRRRGIRSTVWVCSHCWMKSGEGRRGGLRAAMERVRLSIITTVNESALKPANKGLALALLIGVKDDLDPETSRSFASAGAVHVLCVSGLHVGIIYMMVSLLLAPVKRLKKGGRLVFFVLGVSAIWSYAMVTGMPPSVNRASVMFTFMLLGNLRTTARVPMNSVLASAFLLLAQNPSVLFHAGFQLSYLAVTGIITLLPPLSRIWTPKNRMAVRLRDLAGVSLAAQLFTFPVAVKLFHIFPNYFLLTNLLVIPVTGVVMYTGVAFLLLRAAWITPLTTMVFDALLSLMQYLVGFVDQLPGSVSENLSLTTAQLWLLLVAVFSLMLALKGEGRRFLILTIVALLLCSGESLRVTWDKQRMNEVVFYQVRNSSAVDFLSGRTMMAVYPSGIPAGNDLAFATSGYRIRSGFNPETDSTSSLIIPPDAIIKVQHPAGNVIFCNTLPAQKQIPCRVAVIGPQCRVGVELFDRVVAEIYLIDGRMSYGKATSWKTLAAESGHDLWCTRTNGYLRIY
jgi:competence protein ComEC